MRMILAVSGAVMLTLLLDVGFGNAREYPWCAQYSMRGGPTNCGFETIAQCRATVSGIGRFCNRNLRHRPGYAASGNQPAPAPDTLIMSCYEMADKVVPRVRGRGAWVVRHADHCFRNGGRL
jgi:hypothetical protein